MEALCCYGDRTEIINGLLTSVADHEKLFVLVDAPTSRPNVVMRLMEDVRKILQSARVAKTRIFINCGRRMDLMALVSDKVAVIFLRPFSFRIPCN